MTPSNEDRRVAELQGWELHEKFKVWCIPGKPLNLNLPTEREYHPTTNNDQAMALLEKYDLSLDRSTSFTKELFGTDRKWFAHKRDDDGIIESTASSDNPREAIVKAVIAYLEGQDDG